MWVWGDVGVWMHDTEETTCNIHRQHVPYTTGQLAEMDADHTVAKTTLEQTTAALHNAQQETTTLQHHVEDLRYVFVVLRCCEMLYVG